MNTQQGSNVCSDDLCGGEAQAGVVHACQACRAAAQAAWEAGEGAYCTPQCAEERGRECGCGELLRAAQSEGEESA